MTDFFTISSTETMDPNNDMILLRGSVSGSVRRNPEPGVGSRSREPGTYPQLSVKRR